MIQPLPRHFDPANLPAGRQGGKKSLCDLSILEAIDINNQTL